MNNPQDKPSTGGPTNAGRSNQNPGSTTNPGTTNSPRSTDSSRKATPVPAAQSAPAPSVPGSQPSASGFERQAEGQSASGTTEPATKGSILENAVQSGKQWIEDSGALESVNKLPQSVKELGNRALARVNGLTTTQKVVGGTILAVGLGWLATRKGKSADSPYNYGNPRGNNGSYGRRTAGYQAPDASAGRRSATGRADSGAPYGSSGRYGSNTGIQSGSGSGFGSASIDHGSQSVKGSSRDSKSDFGASSNE